MPPRVDGSKIAVGLLTFTAGAIGVSAVYLPFFADRDKLRGLHEEADGGLNDKERQAYEKYLEQMRKQGVGYGDAIPDTENPARPTGNSMWSQLNKAAKRGEPEREDN